MKRLLYILMLLAAVATRVEAQNPGWPVPDDQKGKICLVKFTPDMVKGGEAIYTKKLPELPRSSCEKEFCGHYAFAR